MLKVARVGEIVPQAGDFLATLQQLRMQLQRRQDQAIFQQHARELFPVPCGPIARNGRRRAREGRFTQSERHRCSENDCHVNVMWALVVSRSQT